MHTVGSSQGVLQMTRSTTVSRRTMFAGMGALAGANALAGPASAALGAVSTPAHGGPADRGPIEKGVPADLNPIGSPALAGYTYRYLSMWDFTPENFASGRTWTSAGGVYSPVGSGDTLWAMAELPPGAVLGDVEWYLSAKATTELMGRIWVAGTPTLMKQICDGSIVGSSTPGEVRAARVVASSTTNGPYPAGTMIALGVFTPADASVAINGARIGFKSAPTGEVLLPTPVRVYDSRPGKPIRPKATRTHSLATHLPVGATAAIVTVTVMNTVRSGRLTVHDAGGSAPGVTSVVWDRGGETIANTTETRVNGARKIAVASTGKTDYTIDLLGYTA
jgi:hypothetical protein